MKKLFIPISIFLVATFTAFLYYEYNKPQEPCIEEIVNVVCTKIDSGVVNTDPVGLYRFEVPYEIQDSVRLFYITSPSIGGSWVRYQDIEWTARMLDPHIEIVHDSIKFIPAKKEKYIRGRVDFFMPAYIDYVPLNLKNRLKIRFAIDRHRERQEEFFEQVKADAEKANIAKSCELLKQLKNE
mgnify:CR=1 FL=1